MSYTKLTYHAVWRTYYNEPSIPENAKIEMQKYILSVCQNNKWYLRQLNMHLDHVHILLDLPADVTIASAVQKIKASSSGAFKGNKNFPLFKGWNTGYGAFTVSHWDIDKIRAYIRNQSEHHKYEDSRGELMRWLSENGVSDMEYLDKNM